VALARRRAEAVAEVMVREGVDRSLIGKEPVGESPLTVAIPADTVEPLNRLVVVNVGSG
jgi:outer membrane protein OmpA-like peptidoglycan-associated protein